MVQILEQNNPGAQIGNALGSGLSSALQMLIQNKMQGMQQKQKVESLSNLLGTGPQKSGEVINEEIEYTPGQLIAAEQMYPGSAKILQEHQKQKMAETKEKKELGQAKSAIEKMYEALPSVGPGKIGNYLTEEGRENRQYFNTLAVQLEKIAAGMVGKGTLSQSRFKFLLRNLPSASKTQAANKGSLKAWSQILDIEPDLPTKGLPSAKNKEDKTITQEIAMKFLSQAKGDKDIARKLAKQNGYQF